MTNWPARIDALLAGKPDMLDMPWHQFKDDLLLWYQSAHRVAAERLREPHVLACSVANLVRRDDGLWHAGECTCGKDRDLLRILEGKR